MAASEPLPTAACRKKRRPLVRIKHAGGEQKAETKRPRRLSPGAQQPPGEGGGGEEPAAGHQQQARGDAEEEGDGEGLGGLLGAYGSDSDSEDSAAGKEPAAAPRAVAALPSASELLGTSRPEPHRENT